MESLHSSFGEGVLRMAKWKLSVEKIVMLLPDEVQDKLTEKRILKTGLNLYGQFQFGYVMHSRNEFYDSYAKKVKKIKAKWKSEEQALAAQYPKCADDIKSDHKKIEKLLDVLHNSLKYKSVTKVVIGDDNIGGFMFFLRLYCSDSDVYLKQCYSKIEWKRKDAQPYYTVIRNYIRVQNKKYQNWLEENNGTFLSEEEKVLQAWDMAKKSVDQFKILAEAVTDIRQRWQRLMVRYVDLYSEGILTDFSGDDLNTATAILNKLDAMMALFKRAPDKKAAYADLEKGLKYLEKILMGC